MAGQRLKDFLNSSDTNRGAQRVDFVLDDDTASILRDLGIDPNTHKPLLDLTEADQGLIGEYLEWLMKQLAHPDVASQSKNAFRAKSGNEEAESAIRGVPIVNAENQGFKRVFAPGGTNFADQGLNRSNSGNFDEAGSLQDIVDKAVQNPVDIDSEAGPGKPERKGEGHYVLAGIKGGARDATGKVLYNNAGAETSNSRKILNASQGILARKNKFTGSGTVPTPNPFVIRNETTSGIDAMPISSVQTEHGNYKKEAQDYVFKKLRLVGRSMLLKAAGFDTAAVPGVSIDPENQATEEPYEPSEPIDERPNRRINPIKLKPRNAKGAPTQDTEDLEAQSH